MGRRHNVFCRVVVEFSSEGSLVVACDVIQWLSPSPPGVLKQWMVINRTGWMSCATSIVVKIDGVVSSSRDSKQIETRPRISFLRRFVC